MITADDLNKGIELQNQIEVLKVLIIEEKGTAMDEIRRTIFPDKYENLQIGILEVLLAKKKRALEELKEKCRK